MRKLKTFGLGNQISLFLCYILWNHIHSKKYQFGNAQIHNKSDAAVEEEASKKSKLITDDDLVAY